MLIPATKIRHVSTARQLGTVVRRTAEMRLSAAARVTILAINRTNAK
jgi:hypothetical protein